MAGFSVYMFGYSKPCSSMKQYACCQGPTSLFMCAACKLNWVQIDFGPFCLGFTYEVRFNSPRDARILLDMAIF